MCLHTFSLRDFTHYVFLQRVCSDAFAIHRRYSPFTIENVAMQTRVCIDSENLRSSSKLKLLILAIRPPKLLLLTYLSQVLCINYIYIRLKNAVVTLFTKTTHGPLKYLNKKLRI